jgi:ADP-ribose diphosphatase
MTWQLRNRTIALQTPWLRVFRDEYTLPNGTEVDDFYVIERSDFVLVVAEQNGHVALVRQYRPATNRYYYSLPAGYLSPGESPEIAGRRELLEETGLNGEGVRTIGELHALPGYIKSFAFVVICRAINQTINVHDRSEIESAELVPWSTALRMIATGEINEMQAVSALLLAKLVAEPPA